MQKHVSKYIGHVYYIVGKEGTLDPTSALHLCTDVNLSLVIYPLKGTSQMSKLIIVRGLPGAGKSTFAKAVFPELEHVEADQYFMKNGEYNFNKFKLHSAHSYCYNKVLGLLHEGKGVVVSNTFVTRSDIIDYLCIEDLVSDIQIYIFELHTNFGSIHNVPEDTINRMKHRWQNIPSYWKYQPIIIESTNDKRTNIT